MDSASDRQPAATSLRFQLRQRSQRQKRQKAISRRSRGGAGPVRQAAMAAQAKLMAVDSDQTLDEDDEFLRCDSIKISELSSTSSVTSTNMKSTLSSGDLHGNDSLCLNMKSKPCDENDEQQQQHSIKEVRLEPPIYVVRPAPVPPPPDFVIMETTGEEHILHEDHWKLIFSFLGPADLARCMCVCKTWNRWCISPTLWMKINLAHRKIKQKHLIGTVCRQPRHLNLTSAFFSYKQFSWLLARLPQLKELVVSNCCWAALSALCSSSCPLLQLIDLSWTSGVHEECFRDLILPPADRKPGMKDISRLSKIKSFIACGTEITDNVMNILKEHVPLLEILDLSYCMKITDQTVANLATSTSFRQKLKKINFSGCRQITSDCLRYLIKFESLIFLDFKLCNKVTCASLETFTSTYTYQELKVTKDKLVTSTMTP